VATVSAERLRAVVAVAGLFATGLLAGLLAEAGRHSEPGFADCAYAESAASANAATAAHSILLRDGNGTIIDSLEVMWVLELPDIVVEWSVRLRKLLERSTRDYGRVPIKSCVSACVCSDRARLLGAVGTGCNSRDA
jgi:hypothetical protein